MKAIFLCRNDETRRRVYPSDVVGRLQSMVDIEDVTYTGEDVLSDPARFNDTDMIFTTWGMHKFSREEIKTCFPQLKCVFYGAGSVQYFARPFIECGVKVFSAWAANGVPVAEYTVAQIILAGKSFYTQTLNASNPDRRAAAALRERCIGNFRENIGIIGCGMIGSMVAERLKSYDLNVLAFDPFLSDERAAALNVTRVSLEELFSRCRTVTNHLANNEKTQGMLKYEHFSSMPELGTFINTGRGAQVVEDDLVRALTERPDLTAVLDVTYPEPPAEGHPFYTLPNCFMTPHIAGSLGGEVVRMAEYMADECERYLAGVPVRYEVSMAMLETMA
ncbi:MAG: hydroxyacid dehydrogenase [Clostridia bacterium]|nr:hydroxyacid dehydrogenase [Clostridia bacterium]